MLGSKGPGTQESRSLLRNSWYWDAHCGWREGVESVMTRYAKRPPQTKSTHRLVMHIRSIPLPFKLGGDKRLVLWQRRKSQPQQSRGSIEASVPIQVATGTILGCRDVFGGVVGSSVGEWRACVRPLILRSGAKTPNQTHPVIPLLIYGAFCGHESNSANPAKSCGYCSAYLQANIPPFPCPT